MQLNISVNSRFPPCRILRKFAGKRFSLEGENPSYMEVCRIHNYLYFKTSWEGGIKPGWEYFPFRNRETCLKVKLKRGISSSFFWG